MQLMSVVFLKRLIHFCHTFSKQSKAKVSCLFVIANKKLRKKLPASPELIDSIVAVVAHYPVWS